MTPTGMQMGSPAGMTPAGTQIYMSPERCLLQEYSFAADIWSVGMVLHELATGNHPFGRVKNISELYDRLCNQPAPRLNPVHNAPELCSFVAACLTAEAAQRPGTTELLNHKLLSRCACSEEELAHLLIIRMIVRV